MISLITPMMLQVYPLGQVPFPIAALTINCTSAELTTPSPFRSHRLSTAMTAGAPATMPLTLTPAPPMTAAAKRPLSAIDPPAVPNVIGIVATAPSAITVVPPATMHVPFAGLHVTESPAVAQALAATGVPIVAPDGSASVHWRAVTLWPAEPDMLTVRVAEPPAGIVAGPVTAIVVVWP